MKESSSNFWGPYSFQDYLTDHGLSVSGAAPNYISCDSLAKLDHLLRAENTMVLRLGRSKFGTGTQFALVKCRKSFDEYFLNDKQIFSDAEQKTFIPKTGEIDLFPFRLIGTHTEQLLVNLGFASGLIATALKLDKEHQPKIPAMGSATCDFRVRPRSDLNVIVDHRHGQLQIDSLFVGIRNEQPILFVVEAKSDNTTSVAKHKLVYPILALAHKLESDIPIVPVYLRVKKIKGKLAYQIVECSFPDPRLNDDPAIDSLDTKRAVCFALSASI